MLFIKLVNSWTQWICYIIANYKPMSTHKSSKHTDVYNFSAYDQMPKLRRGLLLQWASLSLGLWAQEEGLASRNIKAHRNKVGMPAGNTLQMQIVKNEEAWKQSWEKEGKHALFSEGLLCINAYNILYVEYNFYMHWLFSVL